MPCRISRLLCFTSTQKHTTWNTSWTRSEHYWCGGHSGRCWRAKFKRRIGILQILFDRYWNGEWKTESSTLPCHVLTFLCSTINWIMSSKNWIVLQKFTLHLDSFWKTMRMECVDTFTLTRTILLWRRRNFCVHQTTLPTWKRKYRKWILLIFVHEREPT